MKVLRARFGYMYHNTVTDTYTKLAYLPDNVDTSIFVEVRDEAIDERIIKKIEEMDEKEKSLNKIGKIVANQVTDDIVALEIQEFYDEWQEGVSYEVGRYLVYKNVLYKVLIAHTSQSDWTPDVSPSLFANVLISLDGTPQEWVQPDSTNPYMQGDKVIYEGATYISTVDNNVWQPGVYGWELVGE